MSSSYALYYLGSVWQLPNLSIFDTFAEIRIQILLHHVREVTACGSNNFKINNT